MNEMKKIYFTLFAFLILNLTAFGQTSLTVSPDFTVTTVHGEEVNLFTLLDEGKHVILDFFFTTCGPCIASVPTFNESFEKYGCNKSDIYFLSIDSGDNDTQVLGYEAQYGALLPSASGVDGGGNEVVAAFGVTAFPTTVLIAPDRSIVAQDIWPITHANLDGQINTVAGIETNPEACVATVSIEELENVPTQIKGIYPNPTAVDATLEFSIPEAISIKTEVYNLMGQQVLDIPFNNFSQGTNTILIPTSNLVNGTYTVNLIQADGKMAITKLSVLR